MTTTRDEPAADEKAGWSLYRSEQARANEADARLDRIHETILAGLEGGDSGPSYVDPEATLHEVWDALNIPSRPEPTVIERPDLVMPIYEDEPTPPGRQVQYDDGEWSREVDVSALEPTTDERRGRSRSAVREVQNVEPAPDEREALIRELRGLAALGTRPGSAWDIARRAADFIERRQGSVTDDTGYDFRPIERNLVFATEADVAREFPGTTVMRRRKAGPWEPAPEEEKP